LTHYRKLVGALCYLSPPDPADAEAWAAWDNDLEVTLPLGDEAYGMAAPERERERIVENLRDQRPTFSILDLATDRLIGRCMLFDVDHVNRRAMLGIVIGEKDYWNRGYGQDALRLLLDYGFNLLNLNSVMLGTFEFNHRALQAYRRVGFKEIGRQREARIIAGIAYDVVLMDILAEECGPGRIVSMIEKETSSCQGSSLKRVSIPSNLRSRRRRAARIASSCVRICWKAERRRATAPCG